MTLDQLRAGQSAVITAVGGQGVLRRRLLDMGLTPDTHIYMRKVAPLGDPMELYVRGYELTLRAEEAKEIQVVITSERRRHAGRHRHGRRTKGHCRRP